MEKTVPTDVPWVKVRLLMQILQSASTFAMTAAMRAAVLMDFFKSNFLGLSLFLRALICFRIL
jgi:hypothetical protein